ncbi:MAG: hypothetical protein A2745_01870 [Candidatus Harrisonbacteria bacterium RIFCSPHIGHO2_01_FULL_44_13]|uniref:Septum formation initiator n=1 Tax=Candidatus Harrisonbacteria bacterium RIFCSPLOWO2_01_FULL_44_18 TaxID=1798407 RepID=A0A1G1ZLV1_9BACT|nr:MAG: hypothetical protein A2745_01870 [Candidatus Harrisonbacteria bacterium RIFCSPHIGHO2_01_FULL_44_13]OGY65534.1 MAG: hypothetical protein A3A16_01570 [Candidatus Harrisonbacteria bacterium RIFCSPLOWO2_01_FULL_44_18]
MKLVTAAVLVIIFAILGFQLYRLYAQQLKMRKDSSGVIAQVEKLAKENENLQADIVYFSDPKNLEKELRSKFNYVKPGEKLIILIPKE